MWRILTLRQEAALSYEEKRKLTKERMASALEWERISPENCQHCGKAAAYKHPRNGYVCSSCPRYG